MKSAMTGLHGFTRSLEQLMALGSMSPVLNQRSRHEAGLDFIFAKVRFAAEADGFLCLGANISCSLFLESAIVDECHGVANIEISQSCSYKKD
jgi:hypothetical protein